jgi:sucrose-6-phosphate hydrolase SacC (GH32 family)
VSYPAPKPPYNQHFSFPVTLNLRTTNDGIRMFAKPIEEIANLRKKTYSIPAQSLPDGQSRSTPTSGMLFDIRAEFEVGDAEKVTISGGGLNITYDAINKTLQGRPLEPLDGKVRIQAVVDNSLLEIAGNDGRIMIHAPHGHSITLGELKITAHGGDAELVSFEAHELNSIWSDKSKTSVSPVQE